LMVHHRQQWRPS